MIFLKYCNIFCIVKQILSMFKPREFVLQFFNALDDQYSQLRLQILQTNPLPSINQAFSKVLQQESHTIGNSTFQDKSSILLNAATVLRSYSRGRESNLNANKICTHCGKSGHTVDVWYRKHRFPPNFKFKNGNPRPSVANNAFQPHANVGKQSVEPTLAMEGGLPSLSQMITQEQYHNLVALLQCSNLTASATSN